MGEPKYDEDVVNLGYLNRIIKQTAENISIPDNISRHYGSKPNPPYYKGDTWIDGSTIYTCINTREIGLYDDSDWVTESGAKEVADEKSRVFLSKPYNYKPGDMWVLQSDNDHKAGKKGEILISIAGRTLYSEDDWINMLGYGTIRSVNEVANNINEALERLKITKEAGKVTIFYTDRIPTTAITNDLWYVTDNLEEGYLLDNVYQYDGKTWEKVEDKLAIVAFEEANEARLVGDGKIQVFYSEIKPTSKLGVGDLWKDTSTQKLYRYNGTNWVAVYETNLKELQKDIETLTEINTSIMTDLGKISLEVSKVEKKLIDIGYKDEVEDITELYISSAQKADLLKLEIKGNKTFASNVFPRGNLYPSSNLYLH